MRVAPDRRAVRKPESAGSPAVGWGRGNLTTLSSVNQLAFSARTARSGGAIGFAATNCGLFRRDIMRAFAWLTLTLGAICAARGCGRHPMRDMGYGRAVG